MLYQKNNEAIEKNNRNIVVIWHFQFYDAIKTQPTNVGLFNDAGTYQMSLGFHKVMETLAWLRDAGPTRLRSLEDYGMRAEIGAS